MNTETTLGNEYTSLPQHIYMAIELSLSEWKHHSQEPGGSPR
jgi:hypothetical protein